jgi:hypothetical protein
MRQIQFPPPLMKIDARIPLEIGVQELSARRPDALNEVPSFSAPVISSFTYPRVLF